MAHPGNLRPSLVNVHSFVHSKGDIHLDTVRGPRPTTEALGGKPRALVISRPSAPTLFRRGPSSSASEWQLSVIIFVGQWNVTLDFLFGFRQVTSRRSTGCLKFDAAHVGRLCAKPLTFTSTIVFEYHKTISEPRWVVRQKPAPKDNSHSPCHEE